LSDETAEPPETRQTPPQGKTVDTVHRINGVETADPYAWLRTADWQTTLSDPSRIEDEIRRHLEAENAYLEHALADVRGLRDTLKAELRGRMPEREAGVPVPDGDWAYYVRYQEGAQHPLWCRCPRASAEAVGQVGEDGFAGEEVLLDGNAAAEGQAFFRLGAAEHSPDHRYFAYAVDLTGSEYHRLKLLDTATGKTHDLGAAALQGDLVWANDSRTLLYTALDDNHRPSRVYRTDVAGSDHVLLYTESDPAFYLGVGKTESRALIVIAGSDHADTTELRALRADQPDGTPQLLHARAPELDVQIATWRDRALLLTNADGARDYKIVEAPLGDPARANWRELVPHRPGTLIKSFAVFARYLVRLELADAQPRVVVRDLDSGAEHTVDPGSWESAAANDSAYSLALLPGEEFETTTLRLAYSSPRAPRQTYDYDMAAGTARLRKQQRVPSGHAPEAYRVERRWVASHDGAQVPVTLLYRADAPPRAGRPLLLYGYGAYGMAVPAGFSPDRLSLVDRGMVYAIAHVRGGSDRGYGWYLDGKLAHKENTFRDFIAVAEQLVADGTVDAGDIVANGRSAGGMLMGVIANWRPELWRAVVGEVPFVDVFNTMCDDSLPLTPPEWSEWGDPLHDSDATARMLGYSPYDNVQPRAYPHVLATAGIADPRVTYWEPAKWVARLRANQTGPGRILLHTNMQAGHAGAAGRFARLDEVALVQAFMLKVAGLASD
jgi:oligopeptidase B